MEAERQEQFNFLCLKKYSIKEKGTFVSQEVGFYWVTRKKDQYGGGGSTYEA